MERARPHPDATLNETLAALGIAKRPASNGWTHQGVVVLSRDGKDLMTGDAGEVWAWLRSEGLIQ